jgi:hypothetical protein
MTGARWSRSSPGRSSGHERDPSLGAYRREWQSFVLAAPAINQLVGNQKTVAISRISNCCSAVGFADLNAEIDRVVFDGLSDLLTFTSTSSTGQGRIAPVSSLFLSPMEQPPRSGRWITMLFGQGPVRRFILSHATC